MSNRVMTFATEQAAQDKQRDYIAMNKRVVITRMSDDFRVYDNGTFRVFLGGEWLLLVSDNPIT
jgi:hypothetical protein